jgi:hypothetical protein
MQAQCRMEYAGFFLSTLTQFPCAAKTNHPDLGDLKEQVVFFQACEGQRGGSLLFSSSF